MPVGTEVNLGPGQIVLDGDPAPPERGKTAASFRPMSIVAKWLPISDTAEHLLVKQTKLLSFAECYKVDKRTVTVNRYVHDIQKRRWSFPKSCNVFQAF